MRQTQQPGMLTCQDIALLKSILCGRDALLDALEAAYRKTPPLKAASKGCRALLQNQKELGVQSSRAPGHQFNALRQTIDNNS